MRQGAFTLTDASLNILSQSKFGGNRPLELAAAVVHYLRCFVIGSLTPTPLSI